MDEKAKFYETIFLSQSSHSLAKGRSLPRKVVHGTRYGKIPFFYTEACSRNTIHGVLHREGRPQ